MSYPDFATYFRELWRYDPFPWQAMLAERVAAGRWPRALDLPTASGKTACIEVALWALASQADLPLAERTAPRRIWFVVDRRIVVDEAFDRAQTIAERLASATGGPLAHVAERLRRLAGTARPLGTARLRGGVLRDDGWARLPSQPAVITSTVDQLGSHLLFRGYGRSHLAAPIFAGLAANDSLVLLDEAHCSVPFLQTLRLVGTYRGRRWAHTPVPAPFTFVVLSATPPAGLPEESVFPGAARGAALDDPLLRQRLESRKPAEFVEVQPKRGEAGEDPLIQEAAGRAHGYLGGGARRVAVMVNRVRTAARVAGAVRDLVHERADVVLLTGRMRPYERDRLVERWKPFLKANAPVDPPRPVVVVSTQCLEVGADFSFDALVTEASSLDSLRQRFGRLDRTGELGTAPAAVLIRVADADPDGEPDPVYGSAIARTWEMLRPAADFGFEALRRRLEAVGDLSPCLAPSPDAPFLLPAHLDMLCQTAPTPHPEPDVALFLHGKQRGAPEVRVVWRADLASGDEREWIETVALCPPASGEMLAVPLHRARAWLAGSDSAGDVADVEGVAAGEDEVSGACRPFLLWRGRDRSAVGRRAEDILPGDVLVVPASYGMDAVGQSSGEGLGAARLDLFEPAMGASGSPAPVRLHRAVLRPWVGSEPLAHLLALAEAPAFERAEVLDAVDALLELGPEELPAWWLALLRRACGGRFEVHPSGGLVLFAGGGESAVDGPDLFADDDDLASAAAGPVSLDAHSEQVRRAVENLAALCLPEEHRDALGLAAQWHDSGKLDDRFQVLLHEGDELAALSAGAALAKSGRVAASPARRRALREATGLPGGFRHEMLSVQIAQRYAPMPQERDRAELMLHLVASHHGHARPFAPVCADAEPPAVEGHLGGTHVALSAEARAAWASHRLDSGIADRFWRLTRRYGWWGLAYLEAILRLGDWYASGLAKKSEVGQ